MKRRYKIRTPTIALDGEKLLHLPAESAITIAARVSDGEALIDVVWEGRVLKMFTRDLMERAEEVRE